MADFCLQERTLIHIACCTYNRVEFTAVMFQIHPKTWPYISFVLCLKSTKHLKSFDNSEKGIVGTAYLEPLIGH